MFLFPFDLASNECCGLGRPSLYAATHVCTLIYITGLRATLVITGTRFSDKQQRHTKQVMSTHQRWSIAGIVR